MSLYVCCIQSVGCGATKLRISVKNKPNFCLLLQPAVLLTTTNWECYCYLLARMICPLVALYEIWHYLDIFVRSNGWLVEITVCRQVLFLYILCVILFNKVNIKQNSRDDKQWSYSRTETHAIIFCHILRNDLQKFQNIHCPMSR